MEVNSEDRILETKWKEERRSKGKWTVHNNSNNRIWNACERQGYSFSSAHTFGFFGIARSKSRPYNETLYASLAVYWVRIVGVYGEQHSCVAIILFHHVVSMHQWPHSHCRYTHIFDPLNGLHYQDSLVSVTSWTSEAQRPGTDFH